MDGLYRLWLEPGVLRSESPARATIRPVLDGRYVVHDYGWADQGAPQHGTMLFGFDGDDVWHMAWIDTWHTGRSIMACKGEAGPGAMVQGSYGGGGHERRRGRRRRAERRTPETRWSASGKDEPVDLATEPARRGVQAARRAYGGVAASNPLLMVLGPARHLA